MRVSRFYSSWISLIIFIGLTIFIPYRVSLFTFKISDVWLLICLSFQYRHGFDFKINFRNRRFIKNFGIWMGLVAIIATVFQAMHDGISIDPVFFSHFYRFFRFFLIFKLVESVILNSHPKDLLRFLNSYTVVGTITIIFAFVEFYSTSSFQKIIESLYYVAPEKTFAEYFKNTGRLSGVMGNPNATAIFITSTIVYPGFNLILRGIGVRRKLLFLTYLLAAVFVIVVMTASRTSIIISGLILILLLFYSFSKIRRTSPVTFILIIATLLGYTFYTQFSKELIIPERVVYVSEGKNTRGESAGIIEITDRSQLWQNRFTTFKNDAHPFAVLIGMGYTKLYKDYSDNGLLSAFFNLGLPGLLMRLFLYYLVIKYCVIRSFRNFKSSNNNYLTLILGLISFVLILFELTAETIEHIKLGQLFYLFFCVTFVYNAYYNRLKRINASLKSESNLTKKFSTTISK